MILPFFTNKQLKSPNFDYDDYKDSAGNPMPWISQETFTEGQVITVKSYLDTPHNGHMELKACPNGDASTQECFDTPGHELIFQDDVLYNMPADPSYPGRGYYAGGQGGGLKSHEMRFKLPDNIKGDKVMLQYKYITANRYAGPPIIFSCIVFIKIFFSLKCFLIRFSCCQ